MRALAGRTSAAGGLVGSRVLSRAALLIAAATSLAALGADCEGNVVQDPTFRDWCGSSLCAWHLDSGRIQRVPTWNPEDFGVSFLDDGTEISQVTQEDSATCLLFKTVADIDPSAQMTLLVDFDNDGIVDFQAPLGATQWHQVQAEISAPAAYRGITFHLKKEGTGAAVLAEMQVLSTTGCTAPAPVLPPQPLAGACATPSDCQKGLVCTSGKLCAQCDDATPCVDGVSCAMRVFQAAQCGPGQGLGKPGDPCALADDCASQACDGTSATSIAAVFGSLDAGCPTAAPQCDVDAALDSSAAVCACFLNHGGTCR
jgi:hypothetical protein